MSLTNLNLIKPRAREFIAPASLALLAILVYVASLAPGVYGFDSAELATGVFTLGIVHPPGYPLYLMIGKIFTSLPFRDIAYRLNLMSALWGCVTLLFVYKICFELCHKRWISWGAAFFLGISNYFWQMSIIAEVYTLHTALFSINLWLLLRWTRNPQPGLLRLCAFTYGLSLCNHTSGILFAPGFAYLVLSSRKWQWKNWKLLIELCLLFCAGLLPYLYLPIRAISNPPLNYVDSYYNVKVTSPQGLWWMFSGQAYRFFIFGYSLQEIPAEIARFLSYLWRNFLGAGVLLTLAGIPWLLKKDARKTIALLLMFICVAFFYINYRVMDKDTMFLPAYVVGTLFLACGLAALQEFIARRLNLPNLAGKLTNVLTIGICILGLALNWRWVSMSQMHQTEVFAQELLTNVEPGSYIIASWSPAVVLEYYQVVHGMRPDVEVLNRSRVDVAHFYTLWKSGMEKQAIFEILQEDTNRLIETQIETRTVYAIEYDPALAMNFEYLPEGNFYRIAEKTR